jgi:hypothetical protein
MMAKWQSGIFIRERGMNMIVKVKIKSHVEIFTFPKKGFTMHMVFEKFDEMAESVNIAEKI